MLDYSSFDETVRRQWDLSDWLVDLLGDAADMTDDPTEADRFEVAAQAVTGLHVDRLESLCGDARRVRSGAGALAAARLVCSVLGVVG
ncbi:hypothetical protein [Caenispirillum bisanense]|uniref:hypothetical protein n=1 Tax=Caenispirillum bisanense TaxID=414052 RepID=UPI0011442255|nr:hypothetical protein [Caenispirillum bisanense]